MPVSNLAILVKMSGGMLPPNSRAGDVEIYDNGRMLIFESDTDIVERQIERQKVIEVLQYAREVGFFQLPNIVHDSGSSPNVPDVTLSIVDAMGNNTVTMTSYQRLKGEMRKAPFDLIYKRITDLAWESYTSGTAPAPETPAPVPASQPAAPQRQAPMPNQAAARLPAENPIPQTQIPPLPFSNQAQQSNPQNAPFELPSLDDLLKSSGLQFDDPSGSATDKTPGLPPLAMPTLQQSNDPQRAPSLPPLNQQMQPGQAPNRPPAIPPLQAVFNQNQPGQQMPPVQQPAPARQQQQPPQPKPQPQQPKAPQQQPQPRPSEQIAQQPKQQPQQQKPAPAPQPVAPAAKKEAKQPAVQQPVEQTAPKQPQQQAPRQPEPPKQRESVPRAEQKPAASNPQRVNAEPPQARQEESRPENESVMPTVTPRESAQPERTPRQQEREQAFERGARQTEREQRPERDQRQPEREQRQPDREQRQSAPDQRTEQRPERPQPKAQGGSLPPRKPPVAWERTQESIERLEESLHGKVLVYYAANTYVSMEDMRYLYSHLRKLGKKKSLYLLPIIQDADSTVIWRMATLVREFCDELTVILPEESSVATTMMALSGDSIMMNPFGFLSPVDTWFSHKLLSKSFDQESVAVPLNEIFQASGPMPGKLPSKQKEPSLVTAQDSETFHPLVTAAANRQLSLVQRICTNLLRLRKTPGTDAQIAQTVQTLTQSYPSSDYPIVYFEAKNLGLPVVETSEAVNDVLWDLIKEYAYLTEPVINFQNTYRMFEKQNILIESTGRRTIHYTEEMTDANAEQYAHPLEMHSRWRELTQQISINPAGKESHQLVWKELQLIGSNE